MKVLAIDPGNIESAYVIWDGEKIHTKGKVKNDDLFFKFTTLMIESDKYYDNVVIEMIASYGMPVGQEVFDTCVWIGRYYQKFESINHSVKLIKRGDVKLHLCNSRRAKDSNIRQALIDRFEPDITAKQRPKGILKGLTGDEWAAFALAVYYFDNNLK
ncbi:MAG: hypothetical protein WC389_21070 [Lutibacter sp.]|jgi:hypothetical protein